MDEEKIKELENQLRESLESFAKFNDEQLRQARYLLDSKSQDVIGSYSNEIRNLSIISGVLAPLSLTLLGVQNLEVNKISILWGFSILILNILVSYLFINRKISEKDKQLTRADLNWIFAKDHQEKIKNNNIELGKRVTSNYDYLKEMDKVREVLGAGYLNLNIVKDRSDLRKNNKITFYMLSTGTGLIILSIIINPLINLLYLWYLSF